MKNLKTIQNYFFLFFFAMILFSCNSDKEKLIIEEIQVASNDSIQSKYKVKIEFGSHYSFSTHSKNEIQDVKINFHNKKLSVILDKFKYPYETTKLVKNPLLKIEYYKENTTREKAVKEIVAQLKKMLYFSLAKTTQV